MACRLWQGCGQRSGTELGLGLAQGILPGLGSGCWERLGKGVRERLGRGLEEVGKTRGWKRKARIVRVPALRFAPVQYGWW